MLKLISVLSFVALVYAALPPPHSNHPNHHHGTSICGFITNADCSIFATHKVCGTDSKTYNNNCEFSQAHCTNMDLHAAHNGTCDPTVQKPDPNVHGNDLVYQFFCANLQHSQCGNDMEILCGTDMNTYDNLCMYEKARCANPDLLIFTYQGCPAGSK